jgi:ABC-type transport system involved in cytochrome bd biosynthesis fused ATPase/permease subunit
MFNVQYPMFNTSGRRARCQVERWSKAALGDCSVFTGRILLLDEATSALDAKSEHLVQDAIAKVEVGSTSQIVVVDDHQIVDVGSHDVMSCLVDVKSNKIGSNVNLSLGNFQQMR